MTATTHPTAAPEAAAAHTAADDAVPAGYMRRANGTLVPASRVTKYEKTRDKFVREQCELAERMSRAIKGFRDKSMSRVDDFLGEAFTEYGVKSGGAKGNITLTTFDGNAKIEVQVHDLFSFDERLQAAKTLIDDCVMRWSRGSNANLRALVDHAFQVDKAGLISKARVLQLRSLKIEDEQWAAAMRAIADSMHVTSSRQYIRFYRRAAGRWVVIPLDAASA